MKYVISLMCVLLTSGLVAQVEDRVTYTTSDSDLKTIFEELKELYGVSFSYPSEAIDGSKYNYSFSNETLDHVLTTVLFNAGMEYKIAENNVLVRSSNNPLLGDTESYNTSLHLKGKVTSSAFADQGVDFAAVVVLGTPIGTYTDPDGTFELAIPEEYQDSTLTISYVGLDQMHYQISELEDEYLLVALEESSIAAVEEIMIVNRTKPIAIKAASSATVLQGSSLRNFTSGVAGTDINRMIQFLPGIVAHNDKSAELLIRGGNSDETMVILDGMPLYQTTHYYKIFSIINPLYVDSVTVYKNNYPLKYSGGTSGLVDIRSTRSHPSKVEGQIALDLMKTESEFAIPIGKKSSLHIAARSSLGDINNDRFNTAQIDSVSNFEIEEFDSSIENLVANTSSKFHNFNAKYQYIDGDRQYLSLNIYRSNDNLNTHSNGNIKDNRKNAMNLRITDDASKSTMAGSILYDRQLSPDWSLSSFAYAKEFDDSELTTIDIDKELGPDQNDPGIKNPQGENLATDQTNKIKDYGGMVSLKKTLTNGSLDLGVMGTMQEVIYNFRENSDFLFRGKDETIALSGFAGYTFSRTDKFNLQLGIRSTYYSNIEKVYLSPRISSYYKITPSVTLKSTFNIYQQVIRKLYYEYQGLPKEIWITANDKNLPVLNSANIMVGTTIRLGNFTLDTELFYKKQDGLIEYLALEPSNNNNDSDRGRDYRIFNGDGRSMGMDVILSTNIQSYETFLTYTLSLSQERYDEIFDNAYYNSENDRRHQLTWVNSYRIGAFELNANGVFSSGRTYTDISMIDVGKDVRSVSPEERLSTTPDYFRIDLGGLYNFNLLNKKSSIGLSVLNLLNHQNVSYVQSVSTQFVKNQQPENIILGSVNPLLNRTINAQLILRF